MNQFDDSGFLVERDEFEFLLDEAMTELDESELDRAHIDIIRQACGKSPVANRNCEMLDSMFNDFDKIFGKGKSAPLQV